MATRKSSVPIITFTTDFGTADHFAGVMKGVILSLAPHALLVDLSHDVSSYEVAEAAFLVAQAYPYFPPRTVHVVVVDPGVGSQRRPLLMQTAGQYFVGPDNGVFAQVFSREPKRTVRVLENPRYRLPAVSQTFHGRDIFAPAAAHLARGVTPARFGPKIEDYLRPLSEKPVRTARRGWTGSILKVDKFGNLVTNFTLGEFPQIAAGRFELQVGLQLVSRFASCYAENPFGEPFLISGSSGYLEVSVNQGSAAKQLGCAAGAPVELRVF